VVGVLNSAKRFSFCFLLLSMFYSCCVVFSVRKITKNFPFRQIILHYFRVRSHRRGIQYIHTLFGAWRIMRTTRTKASKLGALFFLQQNYYISYSLAIGVLVFNTSLPTWENQLAEPVVLQAEAVVLHAELMVLEAELTALFPCAIGSL